MITRVKTIGAGKRRRKAWCLVVGLRIEERHALEE
jgi:hypothetical protein